ncbi:MAG TPA: IS21 family transposase [Woeseiaceae bacterium]|nr:IS21 family transposase [Woeseiaceae bacterium]
MAEQHAITRLAEHGWSYRRIAREMGIHRETVARYVRLARDEVPSGPAPPAGAADSLISITGRDPTKPAISITGSDGLPSDHHGPKPAISIVGSQGRRSHCEPYRAVIMEFLERGLTAQRIWQDLRTDHGFSDSYQSIQRFVRGLRTAHPLPFRRMECEPGAEAQIDFGAGAPVIVPIDANGANGKTRRRQTHVLRVVLSHSRKAYSEVVYRQTAEEFVRCIENAFRHFGGAPRTLVVDNLKAAVIQADWFDPEINPKVQAFCEYYGTVILPTKPYTPRHKGKTERGIGYVKDNGLKGRTFTNLQEQNEYLLEWEAGVADTRIHGTTKKQVSKLFEEVERSALLPLPVERFPFFHEAQRRVHRDGHVEVEKAYYSAPPEYVGRRVWARWDGRVVRIFNDRLQQIAIHVRHEAGRFSTQSKHIVNEKIAGVERGAEWLLKKIGRIGPHAARWAESMLAERGIQGIRLLVGVTALANRHSYDAIEQACEIAQTHRAYRLRALRELIKRTAPKQEQFEFTQQHPIIRSLGEYGSLVRRAIRNEPTSRPRTEGEPAPQVLPQTPSPWASFPSLLVGTVTTPAETSSPIGEYL